MYRFLLLILFANASCQKNASNDFNLKGNPLEIEEIINDALIKDGKVITSTTFEHSSILSQNTLGSEFDKNYDFFVGDPSFSKITFDSNGLATATFHEELSKTQTTDKNFTFDYAKDKLTEVFIKTVYSPTNEWTSTVNFIYSKSGLLNSRVETRNNGTINRVDYGYNEDNKLINRKEFTDDELRSETKLKYSNDRIIKNYNFLQHKYTAQSIAFLDKDGLLIREEDDNGNKRFYKYDDKNLTEFKSEGKYGTDNIKNVYEKFDDKGNWTRKIIYYDSKPRFVVVRKFKY